METIKSAVKMGMTDAGPGYTDECMDDAVCLHFYYNYFFRSG